MLTFEQIKAIENALGADKAAPIIQAFESVEERVKSELVTTSYLDMRVAEIKGSVDTQLASTKSYVDVRLAEIKTEIIKWVAGMLVAQAALIATLVKLL